MSQDQSKTETTETVQTVQKTLTRNAFIELAKDEDGTWHWQLWAPNGRPIARSAVGYERKKDCIQTIKKLRPAFNSVKMVVQSS